MNPNIEEGWKAVLEADFQSSYFKSLKQFLIAEKENYKVFPKGANIFSAFNLTPFNVVKVVIIGQDPYHNDGQAHGLSFSVPEGVSLPPSLVNIFKELQSDLGVPRPSHGNLTYWASQGVLLLNAVLTVRAHAPASHQGKGWELFTDAAIRALSENRSNLVFLLWGNYAIRKSSLIDASKHLILTSVHPSPLSASRGFFGCKHFSKTNNYLISNGLSPIDWEIK
ncbi:MAG: uracil-DNA glycosylase [Bacteroidales bacterium]|nr:uracil-DNA glycosylase [Bacteroidales bacterium]